MGAFIATGVPAPRLYGRAIGDWPSCVACRNSDEQTKSWPVLDEYAEGEGEFWLDKHDEVVLYSLECQ
jgi:hypothetical protein